MTNYIEKIINIETNETEFRNYTKEEIAISEKNAKEVADELDKYNQMQLAKIQAFEKLKALGLDETDLKALGL